MLVAATFRPCQTPWRLYCSDSDPRHRRTSAGPLSFLNPADYCPEAGRGRRFVHLPKCPESGDCRAKPRPLTLRLRPSNFGSGRPPKRGHRVPARVGTYCRSQCAHLRPSDLTFPGAYPEIPAKSRKLLTRPSTKMRATPRRQAPNLWLGDGRCKCGGALPCDALSFRASLARLPSSPRERGSANALAPARATQAVN